MLTEAQLQQISQILTERQARLEQQLLDNGDAARPVELDQQLQGRLSRMDAIQQQHMAAAGRQQMQAGLKAIRVALKKLDDDDYGFCEACDEPIAWPRLQANPVSKYCIDCQSKMEC